MSAYSDLILASSPNFYYTMEDAFSSSRSGSCRL